MGEDGPQLEAFRALRWSHCDITLKPSQESNSSRNRKVFGIECFMGMEYGFACRWIDAIKLVAAFGIRRAALLIRKGRCPMVDIVIELLELACAVLNALTAFFELLQQRKTIEKRRAKGVRMKMPRR